MYRIYLHVTTCYILSYGLSQTETSNQIFLNYLELDFNAVFDTFPAKHVIMYSCEIETVLTLVNGPIHP